MVKRCDTDRDGRISYEEFFTAASDRAKVLNEKYLRQAFDIMDIDGDGKLRADEIRACFSTGKIGEYEAAGVAADEAFFAKIIEQIDVNGDGYVTYEEFESHMLDMLKEGKKGQEATPN